jgi:hypothetical protein
MKNKIKAIFLITGLAGLITTACNSTQQSNDAGMVKTDTIVTITSIDSQSMWKQEWEGFKAQANAKIKENEDSLEAIRKRGGMSSEKAKYNYEKEMTALKIKNEELKMRLENYKEESKERWKAFRSDLNNGLDSIGQGLSKLTKPMK